MCGELGPQRHQPRNRAATSVRLFHSLVPASTFQLKVRFGKLQSIQRAHHFSLRRSSLSIARSSRRPVRRSSDPLCLFPYRGSPTDLPAITLDAAVVGAGGSGEEICSVDGCPVGGRVPELDGPALTNFGVSTRPSLTRCRPLLSTDVSTEKEVNEGS